MWQVCHTLGLKYQDQLGIGFEFSTHEQKECGLQGCQHRGQDKHVQKGVGAQCTHWGPQGVKAGGGERRERDRQWTVDGRALTQYTCTHRLAQILA